LHSRVAAIICCGLAGRLPAMPLASTTVAPGARIRAVDLSCSAPAALPSSRRRPTEE
jgi:hypothetical protein